MSLEVMLLEAETSKSVSIAPNPVKTRISELEVRRLALNQKLMAAATHAEVNDIEREIRALRMVIRYYQAALKLERLL